MTPLLKGDDAIAVAGMRVKSAPEEVLSLPLMVDPAYPVKDGSVIYLTADKKGCTTTQNTAAGYVGIVVLHNIGKSGHADGTDSYLKGDVVPVEVKGKLWAPVATAITDLSSVMAVNANGVVDPAGTAINGLRYGGTSVGSQNLTIIELLGV